MEGGTTDRYTCDMPFDDGFCDLDAATYRDHRASPVLGGIAANDDVDLPDDQIDSNKIMVLRANAQVAWYYLLKLLDRIHPDPPLGDGEFDLEYFYSALFETLFDYGDVPIDDDFKDVLKSAVRHEITQEIRAAYLVARTAIIAYMIARGFIRNEADFTNMYEDLVLAISCLADVEALKRLQCHIQESRGGATPSELLTMDERTTRVAMRVVAAASTDPAVQN